MAAGDLAGRIAAMLGAPVTHLEPLPGGISSLTYRATLGGPGEPREVVVKVAPPGRRPVANRDVLRQARLLAAVAGRPDDRPGPATPTLLATDAGRPDDGVAPLFAMELVAGDAFEPATDTALHPPRPALARERVLVAARHLVALQVVTPSDAGLAGEPVLSLEEELGRWRGLWATATGDDLPITVAAQVGADLDGTRPADGPATLVHGDYRLGNLLFEGDRLRAVIDWEIWSFGDRRLDLGWLAAQTHALHRQRLTPPDAAHRALAAALPGEADIVDAYRSAGGTAPVDLGWFVALADYKIGATLAVLVKQNRKRDSPDPVLESRAPGVAAHLGRARRRLDDHRSRDRR